MRIIRIKLLLLLFSIGSLGFSQENKNCDWFLDLKNLDSKALILKNIKSHYFENKDEFSSKAKCKIVLSVNIKDMPPFFINQDLLRNPLKALDCISDEFVDTIQFLDSKASKVLYGADGTVIISSESNELYKKLYTSQQAKND